MAAAAAVLVDEFPVVPRDDSVVAS